MGFWGKEINFSVLRTCEKLEKIVLDKKLTKKQHEQISLLKSVKYLKLYSLNAAHLTQELPNIEILEVYKLKDSTLNIKMPNLKSLRIIKNFDDFIS